MPLQKLEFRPGLNREGTDYANEGGWYDGNKIRFRSGFPEKIGGWTQYSTSQYLGVARSLWNWADLSGASYLGVGTNLKYYISKSGGGIYNDVTPIYYTSAGLSGPFTTVSGSTTVTITDATYNPNVGDYIIISGGTFPFNGVTLSGEYTVTGVTSATTYTITASGNATGSGSGGGTVQIQYEYPIGSTAYSTGNGWGAGPWGGIISPLKTTLTNPFTTTASSTTVTVTQTAHGLSTGNYVSFSGATTVGGIPAANLNKTFQITSTGTDTYTIQSSPATSSISNSGGTVIVTVQTGTQGWGVAYSASSIGEQLRLWSNDNYGSDLYIAPRGGPIYVWQSKNTVATRAVALSSLSGASSVPLQTNQVLTSSIQQFIIAFGADSYIDSTHTFNPMLVRWSDQANPVNWTPAVTNQSGEFALTNGSYIMAGRTTRQEILVWTDSCLYSMQYLGAPYVWGFQVLMDNISVMSPNSMITINNVTYWMGIDKFYMYSGRVETLPCSLRQYVFDDINLNQNYQVFAGSNEGYNEVWWFYVSNDTVNGTAIDKYVIYNYVDRVWYYGTMGRTAWLDAGILKNPIAADYNNRILNHESGVDDAATSTVLPINAYVQSSDFDIQDGHNFGFVWRILPDVNFNGSVTGNPQVTMTIVPRQNSGSAYGVADNPTVVSSGGSNTYKGTATPFSATQQTYNIQQFTGQVYTRLRGRQLSFRIESNQQGCQWQLGLPRMDIRPDGRR